MQECSLFEKRGTFHKEMNAESIQLYSANHLEYSLSKDQYTATSRDLYYSLALTTGTVWWSGGSTPSSAITSTTPSGSIICRPSF